LITRGFSFKTLKGIIGILSCRLKAIRNIPKVLRERLICVIIIKRKDSFIVVCVPITRLTAFSGKEII
jgi:hypothetical protein